MDDAPGSADRSSERDAAGWKSWRPWQFGGFIEGLNAVGTICIFAIMVLINLDIFGRSLFSSPVPGVKELVELSIVAIVFLQLPHTLRVGRITRSDAAFTRLLTHMPRFGHALGALYNLTGALLCALITYGSVPRFTQAWSGNHYVGNQGIFVAPVWPVRMIIIVGCVCLTIQFLILLWRDLVAVRNPGPKTDESGRAL